VVEALLINQSQIVFDAVCVTALLVLIERCIAGSKVIFAAYLANSRVRRPPPSTVVCTRSSLFATAHRPTSNASATMRCPRLHTGGS
jgi:hypothetical protein